MGNFNEQDLLQRITERNRRIQELQAENDKYRELYGPLTSATKGQREEIILKGKDDDLG